MRSPNPLRIRLPQNKRVYTLMKWLLPAFLLTLIVISSIALLGSNQWISEEIINKQLSIAQLTANNLNYRFSNLKNTTTGLMMSIYPYLISDSSIGDIQSYEEYTNISKQLSSYDDSASKLRIYVPDEKSYSSQKDLFYPLSTLKLDETLRDHAAHIGISWIETSTIRLETNSYQDMIGCMLTMVRSDNYDKIAGSLVIYVSANDLMLTSASDINGNDEISLVNRSGEVLASSEPQKIGTITLNKNEREFLESTSIGSALIDDNLFAFSKLSTVDWYLIVRSDSSTINIGTTATVIKLLMWFLSLIVIGLVVIVLVNNILIDSTFSSIMNTVGKLTEQTKKDTGNTIQKKRDYLGVFLSKITNYQLYENAPYIVSEITKSIENRYKEKLELADYQMQSLQAQIKPHFLYNTLDIIKWMVISGNYQDSISTINALSRYLRMSISKKSNIVTLDDEILLGKTYIEIIHKRFQNRFSTNFEIEPETLKCLLPIFILQPIIENSLIHGILYCKKPNLVLNIRTWLEDELLCIEIEDNGNGMPSETLALLRNDAIESKEGYGLKNTRTRLQLFNGQNTRFDIQSIENVGTCVTIVLTAVSSIENHHDNQTKEPAFFTNETNSS